MILENLQCPDLTGKLFLHFLGLVAVGYINEAIDEGNPLKTLDSLLLPTAKINYVDPGLAQHYQDVLSCAKSQKFMVSLSGFVSFKYADLGWEEGARGNIFYPFFLRLVSFLSWQLPVNQNGSNGTVIFLVLHMRGQLLQS